MIYEFTIDLYYTALENTITAPLNVLTYNVGDGSMDVSWDSPLSGVIHHYDILISTTAGGTYKKANAKPIVHNKGRVYNLPFDSTVFTKVRAVDAIGNEGPLSELADDAVADRAVMRMKFVAPLGYVIDDEALFVAAIRSNVVAFMIGDGGAVSGE